jgi:GTP cyclohydrolase II
MPALCCCEGDTALQLSTEEASAAARPSRVTVAARAALPVDGLDAAVQIVAMAGRGRWQRACRATGWGAAGRAPLTRLHSECLTVDVFGSLKCDCGPQCGRAAVEAADGGGILLYLRQEGRGIGLANKIALMPCRSRLDTVEANQRLGSRTTSAIMPWQRRCFGRWVSAGCGIAHQQSGETGRSGGAGDRRPSGSAHQLAPNPTMRTISP